jgi:dihydrofolate synthase / folylpolyglutamate synthase
MAHFERLQDWLNWQESSHPLTIDLGLERVASVYRQLELPEPTPITLTVGGTNGKGSCVAYLEAIYREQGYQVGAYTSPHILKYNERIKIDGKPVEDALICHAFERIEYVRDGISLSYFEFGTLAALIIFREAGVDVQLLEVGLGGRLDAVNIIAPDAAIISSIGIDHVAWLGETRESIGFEKAGIFRDGVPAIVGDPEPPVSLQNVSKERNAILLALGNAFSYVRHPTHWEWRDNHDVIDNLPAPALEGEHQYRNAAAVIMAVSQLQDRLPVSAKSIRSALSKVVLPGRFQMVPGPVPVLLDVGHNPEAVGTLVAYLKQKFTGRRIRAIFAMMRDKDIVGVLEIMKPMVYEWYFAPLVNLRACGEPLMREAFAEVGMTNVNFGFKNFKEAFAAAENNAQPDDLLLVFGSFFLVSEYLSEFDKAGGVNGS